MVTKTKTKRGPKKPQEVVAMYDKPKYADRYTFLTSEPSGTTPGMYMSLGTSRNPDDPQGISMFGDAVPGSHLGRKMRWSDVPLNVRKHVVRRFKED